MTEHGLGAQQKGVAVGGLAQRLRRDGAHLVRCEAVEAAGKAGQAVEAARGRLVVQVARGVEAGTEANGFLQVVEAAIAAALQLADLEPEAVRAHVDRRELTGPARLGAARRREGLHGFDCRGSPAAAIRAKLPRMPARPPALRTPTMLRSEPDSDSSSRRGIT